MINIITIRAYYDQKVLYYASLPSSKATKFNSPSDSDVP